VPRRKQTLQRTSLWHAALLVTALGWPAAAFAHYVEAAQGFISGVTHPILGLDHFLAMLSVGIVSAQLGGRRIITVPAVFVVAMVAGGIAGIRGTEWPLTELGIATSVLILGAAVVMVRNTSNSLAVMLVTAAFGSFHGHAHGVEIPQAVDPVFYAGGFVIATSAIHILGVAIGHFLLARHDLVRWLRYLGAGIAVTGLMIFIQLA
jgi:urease accessory protein